MTGRKDFSNLWFDIFDIKKSTIRTKIRTEAERSWPIRGVLRLKAAQRLLLFVCLVCVVLFCPVRLCLFLVCVVVCCFVVGDATVGWWLGLFVVCVLFVVSMFRVAPVANWSVCVVLFFSDRLFVLNIGVCTTIIRVRFRNVWFVL